MSGADRMRKYRERRRRGLEVWEVQVDVVALSEALVDGGWLAAWDADNREAAQAALAEMLASVTRNGLT